MTLARRLLLTYYLCILNLKGGIGKTTTATHLAFYFATRGYRVLLIDCDLQNNSGKVLTRDLDPPTLTNVLKGEVPLHHAIRKVRDNLYLVPADLKLREASKHITASGIAGYTLLQRSLKALEKQKQLPEFNKNFSVADYHPTAPFIPLEECVFDIVVFDNASLPAATEAALYACDAILSPVMMNYLSYDGLFEIMEELENIMAGMGKEMEVLGVIPYALDGRFKITETYHLSLKKAYEIEVTVPVRTDSEVLYAQPKALTVFETNPTSRVAQDFRDLGEQVLQRIQESIQERTRG
jgi:chromosome partitioning protein